LYCEGLTKDLKGMKFFDMIRNYTTMEEYKGSILYLLLQVNTFIFLACFI